MKKILILFSIIPGTAFCQNGAYDLFTIAASQEESLLHITAEEESYSVEDLSGSLEALEGKEYDLDKEGISLFGIEEKEQKGGCLPWVMEPDSGKEIASLERLSRKIEEDSEDSFSYELSASKGKREPTYENVPQIQSRLFHKAKKKEPKEEKQPVPSSPKVAENEQKSPPKRHPITVKDEIKIIGPEAAPTKKPIKRMFEDS